MAGIRHISATALLAALVCVPAAADPRVNYLLHCGGCHLPDASGAPPLVPTLHDELGKIIATQIGRDYIVRVPGASQAPLSNQELADVFNWLLTEYNSKTLPENFKPLTEKEVAAARSRILADPLKYRAEFWPENESS